MVSSFKDKFKASKSSKQMYSLLLRYTSEISYRSISLQKINSLPVSNRVKYCIANTVFKYWNGIVPAYIHKMFKPSLCRYGPRSQMALDISLRKTNTGQKSLSFYGPKIWSKIGPCIKIVTTLSSFMHGFKKNNLLHLRSQFKSLPYPYDRYYHLVL